MVYKRKNYIGLIIFVTLVVFSVLAGTRPVFSAEITIKIGNVDPRFELSLEKTNGEYVSTDTKCVTFKKMLENSSKGRIEVQNFPAGQLGGERKMWEMTKLGSLEMYGGSISPLPSFVPEAMAVQIPYLFKDLNIGLAVLNGPFGKELNELILKKMGIRVFHWSFCNYQNFMTVKKPVKVPGDLKGMKIRVVEAPNIVEMAKLVGASPTPLPFTEVYTSLATGVIDGLSTGIPLIHGMKFDEKIRHLNVANFFYGWTVIAINEKFYRSLSPMDQYLLQEAALRADQAYQGLAFYGNELWIEYYKRRGFDVQIPDPEEQKKWVTTLRGPMIEWTKKTIGSEWVDKVLQASERVEKELYSR